MELTRCNSIVDNLRIEFDKVFNDYKSINGEWHMMLSAGLDSSLNLAFCHRNKLNVKLNTFSSDTLEDEAIGASRFAKFLDCHLETYIKVIWK